MPIPEHELQRIEKSLEAFCRDAVPETLRGEVTLRFEIDPPAVTVFESQLSAENPMERVENPIVRMRYDAAEGSWRFFYRRSNDRWQFYELLPGSKYFEEFLDEIKEDPTGLFWGWAA